MVKGPRSSCQRAFVAGGALNNAAALSQCTAIAATSLGGPRRRGVVAPPKSSRAKHSTQMFGYIYVGRAKSGGLITMRKIIGPALIVLTLAGCAVGGDLPGDSTWSRDYLKVSGKQAPG